MTSIIFFVLLNTWIIVSGSTDCNATLPSDIVFLVDESGSVNGNPADKNNTNFEKQLDFVATLISGFKIGKDGVQIGLVTFSTDVVIEYYLNQYHDLQTLQQKTRQVGYTHPGLTFTNYGLYEVKNKLFTPSRGDRSYAANILVVLTDGESNLKTPTAISASEVHASNITVFAIGIGNRTNLGELGIIASEPEHVLTVKDFRELQEIRGELMQKICKVILSQPTTPVPTTSMKSTTDQQLNNSFTISKNQ